MSACRELLPVLLRTLAGIFEHEIPIIHFAWLWIQEMNGFVKLGEWADDIAIQIWNLEV